MRTLVVVVALLVPALAPGQTAEPSAAAPTHTMVRAAGMPLRDGELPPGTLTVRVVRSDFANNVADQPVTVVVTGEAPITVRTGPDGRASFPHVAVGTEVAASAVVDGEPLESEVFQMPPESGVRVLLVAGAGARTAPGTPLPSAPPDVVTAAASTTPEIPAAAATASETSTGVVVVRTVLACITFFVCALFVVQRRSRTATGSTSAPRT